MSALPSKLETLQTPHYRTKSSPVPQQRAGCLYDPYREGSSLNWEMAGALYTGDNRWTAPPLAGSAVCMSGKINVGMLVQDPGSYVNSISPLSLQDSSE